MPFVRSLTRLLPGVMLLGLLPTALATGPVPDLKARLDAVTTETHDADAVVVLDHEDVTVRPNGIGTARQHRVIKILRPAAIKRQAVQVFSFDPNTNRLDLVTVRVHRADGDVTEIPLEKAAVQPQAAGSIFWGTKQYLVQLPALRVGDAVETITDMTGFNVAYLADEGNGERNYFGEVLKPPVPGHWHDEVHFWTTGYPVVDKRYTVRMPKDKPLQFELYNGDIRPAVTLHGDHITYAFHAQHLEPLHGESRMEPWQNVAPKLLLATLPTWVDKAKWLYEVSEPQFEADDAIRAKVAEIIAACETDEEKYTALNHWVAENIRYAGTSRGMCEGYTVHKSIETFHDRCGVCKDKAGMLVTMLRVAGFDSFLVMTMARQRVDPIPADQFNHAVTCIRWEDGSLTLLDPTWMPKSRDNWSTLEPLQHVVYGLPEGKELSTSRYFAPEECRAAWNATSQITADNDLRGALRFEAVGAPEGRVRRTLAAYHPDERHEFFERTFRRLSPTARPINVASMDPVDFSGPLQIDADYEAAAYAIGSDTLRVFKLPMLQTIFGDRAMYDLFGHTGKNERKYGIALLATRLIDIEETVKLPTGWTVTNVPDPIDLDGPSAALHFKADTGSTPGEIRYTCQLTIKKWTIPPDEYDNFKEVMDKFEELTGPVVACEVEGAHVQR